MKRLTYNEAWSMALDIVNGPAAILTVTSMVIRLDKYENEKRAMRKKHDTAH